MSVLIKCGKHQAIMDKEAIARPGTVVLQNQAEDIIATKMKDFIKQEKRAAAKLLRMHFHDCFVRGCDGSVLLDSTSSDSLAEKDAPPNNPSLKGYELVDQIKETLEQQCPGVVSCADILAYAARESVVLTGKAKYYSVRGGRKDGRVSTFLEAVQILPSSSANVNTLIQTFASKGLSLKEMVTLQGSHTIGSSLCSSIGGRQDNFNNTGNPDPTLESNLAASLRSQCGSVSTVDNTVEMDSFTPNTFDNKYYIGVLQNKGLFTSDATMLTDKRTLREVQRNADKPSAWENRFISAMIKMGEIEVLTEDKGEIRRKCSIVN